ncbi:MAG TPA: histidine phosphatase family protein [Verrucomicrobiae bacterium]|nr:histidine phosphatase family protein [Verrucomicrobiae bacterium]
MIEVWFEPHAETVDKVANRASGWNDVPLSELGRQQAVDLVERYRGRGLAAIRCSDLQRAVLTAVPTARELHLPIYPDVRLRECDYGDMTGRPGRMTSEERLEHITKPFPGGESYTQCMQRMKTFFDELKRLFDDKSVLIVGHMATHCGIEYLGLGKPLEDCILERRSPQLGWRYELPS